MTLQVKQGGVWSPPSGILVKQGGEWVEAQEMYRKENGIWVSHWTGFGAFGAWDVTIEKYTASNQTHYGLNTLLGYGAVTELCENDPMFGSATAGAPALEYFNYYVSGSTHNFSVRIADAGNTTANVPALTVKFGDFELNMPGYFDDKNLGSASITPSTDLRQYMINNVGNTIRVYARRT